MARVENLKNKSTGIPDEPGVYLMKDSAGEVIYIGKARSLRKRISSYLQKGGRDIKTAVLMKVVRDIDYIVTDSEIEALILESSLIKKNKPKFNIRLKDDKKYPYIAVTLDEKYPRVIYTRTLNVKGRRYFGPYTDAKAARNTVSMISNIFKLKICKRGIPLKKNERPCLNYQIHRCSGVCTEEISREEYLNLVDNAILFMEGNIEPVVVSLESRMKQYSQSHEFEKAARIRDIIFDIQKISQSQKVSTPIGMDQDYIGLTISGSEAIIILFEFRKGVLLGRKISIFENAEYAEPEDIMKSFIINYYRRSEIPQKIITQHKVSDREIIQGYLAGLANRKVSVVLPKTGDDRGIIGMIAKNIDIVIADRKAGAKDQDRLRGLEELQEKLGMENLPETIECFDISNFQGSDAVASMVSFKDGIPEKSGYRRYKIRGYRSQNDPGMIHEVISRRLQHLVNEELTLPDLIIVDGGKPQLSRALEAAGNFDTDTMVISIAKRNEEIYTDVSKNPIILPKTSPALHIVQAIRDEAHRFAVTYHRKLRGKHFSSSQLEDIGIGESKKNIILKHFKSIENLRTADLEEIRDVKGIGGKTAEKIYNFFHENH